MIPDPHTAAHATRTACELADATTLEQRRNILTNGLTAYTSRPLEALTYTSMVTIALATILDKTVELAGNRVQTNPRKWAAQVERDTRKRKGNR